MGLLGLVGGAEVGFLIFRVVLPTETDVLRFSASQGFHPYTYLTESKKLRIFISRGLSTPAFYFPAKVRSVTHNGAGPCLRTDKRPSYAGPCSTPECCSLPLRAGPTQPLRWKSDSGSWLEGKGRVGGGGVSVNGK